MDKRFDKKFALTAMAMMLAGGAYAGDYAKPMGTENKMEGMDKTAAPVHNVDKPHAAAWYAGRQVEEIEGMDVEMANDDDIGDVEHVVRGEDGKIYAVVSVGGFLGIGDKDVAIPLDELQPQEDDLVVPPTMTKDSLKAQPKYVKESYTELDDDYRFSAAADQAMPQAGATASSFSTLDADRDGTISEAEADGNSRLKESWKTTDSNQDGRIDRAEFSAFETSDSAK